MCVCILLCIGVAPTKASTEGESVRMKMEKKRTQRGRDSVGIEIFEKGLEARGAASTREYTCLYIIMTEGEKRTE